MEKEDSKSETEKLKSREEEMNREIEEVKKDGSGTERNRGGGEGIEKESNYGVGTGRVGKGKLMRNMGNMRRG